MAVKISYFELNEIGFNADEKNLKIVVVLDGHLRVLVDEKEKNILKGGFCVIDVGRVTSIKSLVNLSKVAIIDIDINGFSGDFPYLSYVSLECTYTGSDSTSTPELIHIRNLLSRIILMNIIQRPKTEEIICRLTKRVLVLLYGKFLNPQYITSTVRKISPQTMKRFYTISSFIFDHHKEKLSLSQIAENEGLSVPRVSHIWRNLTGSSLYQTITLFRMYRAAKELATSNLAISDIAIECGFSDAKYLFNIFTKIYGMAPSQYRNEAISSRQRERYGLLTTKEIKEVVSDFLTTYYKCDIQANIENLTTMEQDHENHMDRMYKNILCNSHIMYDHFSQKKDSIGYLLLSNNTTLYQDQDGFQVYWEYVYPVMYLYEDFNSKICVDLDLDSFPPLAWTKPVDDFLEEARFILGGDMGNKLSISLNTGKVENRENVMDLRQYILERHPQVETFVRILL